MVSCSAVPLLSASATKSPSYSMLNAEFTGVAGFAAFGGYDGYPMFFI